MGTETVHGLGPMFTFDLEIQKAVLVGHVRVFGGPRFDVETGCDGHGMAGGGV